MTIMSTPPDQLLNGISNELGMQIDGLLGGSYLRNFLVSIDYPNGQLHLQPYLTPPIPDEFRRVGITIGLDVTGNNFVVSSVYPNSDAASKNIKVNDQIVSIDGTSLTSVGYVADADQLLDGTPGNVEDDHVRQEDRRPVAGQRHGLGPGRRSDSEPVVAGTPTTSRAAS